jgi:hypothetical protein
MPQDLRRPDPGSAGQLEHPPPRVEPVECRAQLRCRLMMAQVELRGPSCRPNTSGSLVIKNQAYTL